MGAVTNDEALPEQVALMCRLTYVPLAATVPGALLVAFAMGPTVNGAARVGWIASLGLVAAVRAVACHAYLRAPRDLASTRRWLWLLLGLAAVMGLLWSFAGTTLLPVHQPVREILTTLCLIAVVAIGFGSLSPVPGAYACLAVPAIVPVAIWHLRDGDPIRALLGVLFLVFLLIMLGIAARATIWVREQFRLTRENQALAERLRGERDALDRANEQLRFASEAKSRFLGHVSHELRTPLTVILGYGDLLLRDERDRTRAEALGRIKSAGASLLALVNDLLDVASIEAGQLKLRAVDFAPADLLDEVCASLRGHPESRDLDISCALDASLPSPLRADRERVRQVLLNLGVNALRFTARGGVTLALRHAGDRGGTGTWLRGEVVDTGVGIPAEAQDRLFQPFSQLDDATPRASGGAGLGLAISRSIVERMGGRIGVVSAPGAGSTFWFELPVQAVSLVPATPEVVAAASARRVALQGSVVVAEDVRATRELVAGFLREAGCHPVVEASTGTELLAAARVQRFDLMLVDWQMPELDGLEAIRRIRHGERAADRPPTPIVVLTARSGAEDRAHCLEAGADAVIGKPLELGAFSVALERWLPPASTAAAPAAPDPVPAARGRHAVLVAEDHAGNRQLMRRMLEVEGFGRVDVVATGLEAVAAWEQGTYDVMLLDWQMPELDGLEAMRRIRGLERELGRPRTAIVMVTGRMADQERLTCLDAGADACVAKPYLPSELLDAMDAALAAPAGARRRPNM